jgi:hypothetical protein
MTPATLQTREFAAPDRALEAFHHPVTYAAANADGGR